MFCVCLSVCVCVCACACACVCARARMCMHTFMCVRPSANIITYVKKYSFSSNNLKISRTELCVCVCARVCVLNVHVCMRTCACVHENVRTQLHITLADWKHGHKCMSCTHIHTHFWNLMLCYILADWQHGPQCDLQHHQQP